LQAGARPVSGAQFLYELQRDWARTATVASFKQLLFGPARAERVPANAVSRGAW
jgi:hypothetical protein